MESPDKKTAILFAAASLLVASSASAADYRLDTNGATTAYTVENTTWSSAATIWDLLGTDADNGSDTTVAVATPGLNDTFTFNRPSTFGSWRTISVDRDLSLGGLIFNNVGSGGYLEIAGNNTTVRTLTLNNAAGLTVQAGNARIGYDGDATRAPALALATNQIWSAASGTTLDVMGPVSGNFSIDKTGSGTLKLSGTNTYTGGTTVSAGTLQINDGGSLGSGGITLNAAILQYNRSTATTVNNTLNLAGSSFNTLRLKSVGAGAITYAGNTAATFSSERTLALGGTSVADNTFAGNILVSSGGGKVFVTKEDSGKWILSGANTYTGGTTVNAGMLVLASTGSIKVGIAGVTVASGATLAINGTLSLTSGAATLVNNGGTITLDNTSSVLDLGSLFSGQGTDSTYDLITGTTLTTTGNFKSILFTANANFDTVTFDNTTGKLSFTLTAVPEPGTYGLIGAGALAAASLVRRRRRKAAVIDVA